MSPLYMPAPNSMTGLFSRTQPWSSLGFSRRVLRVCRILVGLVLFSGFVLAIVVAIRGVSFSASIQQAMLCVALVPYLAVLAWAVGCMFIWRPVYRMTPRPTDGSPPPSAPGPDGAPRPAPLRPVSPLILSARAELPERRSA